MVKNADKIADGLVGKTKTSGAAGGESDGSKIGVLKQILATLKEMLSINKKSAEDSARNALFQKQFGSMKGGSKKSGKFDLTGLIKSLTSVFKSLPSALIKGLIAAKLKTIMMIIGIVIALGLAIWALLANPGLRKKIGGKIKQFFKWLWKTISSWCEKASVKAILIASIIISLISLWILGPWGLLVGAVVFIGALVYKFRKQIWNFIKKIGKMIWSFIKTFGKIMMIWPLLIALAFKFRKQIWSFVKKMGKTIWSALKWLFGWPIKLLLKFFPELGQKLKNAIFGLLSKIPFIGKRFKSGGDGDTQKEEKKEEKEEEEEEKEPLRPERKSTSTISNREERIKTESKHTEGGTEVHVNTNKSGESFAKELFSKLDLINTKNTSNSVQLMRLIASSGMLIRKTIVLSQSGSLTGKLGKKKHPLEDILKESNNKLYDINGNLIKFGGNLKGSNKSLLSKVKDSLINKFKAFKAMSLKDKLKTAGKVAGVGALIASGPVGMLVGAAGFGIAKLIKSKLSKSNPKVSSPINSVQLSQMNEKNSKTTLTDEKLSATINSLKTNNSDTLKKNVISNIKSGTELNDRVNSINNITENSSVNKEGGGLKEENKIETLVKALPNAFSIALSDYFDNHKLKLDSKEHDSLEIVSSDRSGTL